MVKLNTGPKLTVLVQLAQTETNKFIATARTLPPSRRRAVPEHRLLAAGGVSPEHLVTGCFLAQLCSQVIDTLLTLTK
jgi:hypothetical protein